MIEERELKKELLELGRKYHEKDYYYDGFYTNVKKKHSCFICGNDWYNTYFFNDQCTKCGIKYATRKGSLFALLIVAFLYFFLTRCI